MQILAILAQANSFTAIDIEENSVSVASMSICGGKKVKAWTDEAHGSKNSIHQKHDNNKCDIIYLFSCIQKSKRTCPQHIE